MIQCKKIGESILFNGDYIEVMDKLIEKGVKVDTIITDPPYEHDIHGGGLTALGKRATKVGVDIDFISKGFNYDKVFSRMLKICKIPNLLIFCSNKQISKIMSYFENKNLSTTLLTWNKTNPSPLCNGKHVNNLEFIVFVRGKGASWNDKAPFEIKSKTKNYPIVSGKNRLHPTQKPVKLIEEYVELHSLKNQVILDCFAGSYTTGIACQNLGRKFIGIELEEKYYNIGIERLENNL